METKNFNQSLAARIGAASIQELVDMFNQSVGNRGWTSVRAAHDQMLVDTLIKLGVDVSAVKKGNMISFLHKVVYDEVQKKLLIANP
jgi:hypothetical protein